MRKFLLAALLAVGSTSVALAGITTLKDNSGQTIPTVDAVGAVPCVIFNSSAKLCSSGAAIVYGVIVSSDAASNFAIFRDSNTANMTTSSFTVVHAAGTGSNSSGNATTQLYKFPVPVAVTGGLSVNLGQNPSTGGMWTILYRKLSTD